jgi:myo-inositol-1(or 4)-monophosphatase
MRYPGEKIISEEEADKKDALNLHERYDLDHGCHWIIDPLDGTLNFLNRIDYFCSAIGIIKNGIPLIGVIFNPVSNEVYFGMNGIESQVWKISSGEVEKISPSSHIKSLKESIIATHISSRPEMAKKLLDTQLINKFSYNFRHIRLLGCGQLALAFVASGKLQAFFQYGSYIWDQLAGVVILKNAKGIASDVCETTKSLKEWKYYTQNILATANHEISKRFETLIFENY